MGLNSRGLYTKHSVMYEVTVNKKDTYSEVARKAGKYVNLATDNLILLTSGGSIIRQDNSGEAWTLGSYLAKKHIAPNKLNIGVAIKVTAVYLMILNIEKLIQSYFMAGYIH